MAEETETQSFLLFSVGRHRYALARNDAREIIREAKVYELPFVPPYIEGIINCRGTPCAVINLLLLLGDEAAPPAEGAFLVLRRSEDDPLCLHISTAETFCEVAADGVCGGHIVYNDEEIQLLDPSIIEENIARRGSVVRYE